MSIKIAALLVAALMTVGVATASESGGLEPANIRLDDVASMQRGARLFFNYCSGCHSLQYLRYSRIAEDLQIDPKDVEKNFVFTGGRIGDHAVSHMPAEDAAKWFGKAPPDLSLEARAKGSDWIYSYLKSFYVDPSRPLGWNNTVFPDVSMPNPLWELQGIQTAVHAPVEAGHDPVIAIGFALAPEVERVAALFPNVRFTIVDAVVDRPNVQSIVFKENEGAYLAGLLAAMASRSGTVGFIGGIDIAAIRNFRCGFEHGARSAGKPVQVLSALVGNTPAAFNDPERGAQLAAGPRYEDASRSERIGLSVLHRCLTRGSSQGTPCSSGSAGSYSRVTW